MQSRLSKTLGVLLAAAAALAPAGGADAEVKKEFNMCWSIYVGWMPWGYANDTGIIKKWADKYGIKINVTQMGDYVECINQFTAGKYDLATSTTMDALAIPSVGGVDTTVLIAGDYSNGNDKIVAKPGINSIKELKGKKVGLELNLVEHLMMLKALEMNGMTESDVTLVNFPTNETPQALSSGGVDAIGAASQHQVRSEARRLGLIEIDAQRRSDQIRRVGVQQRRRRMVRVDDEPLRIGDDIGLGRRLEQRLGDQTLLGAEKAK